MSSSLWFRHGRQPQDIDAFWDTVVEHSPAEPIRPEAVDVASAGTIRRLHTLAPQPAPPPAFAARLLEELTAMIPESSPATPAPSQSDLQRETTMTTATIAPQAPPGWLPRLPTSRTSRRWVMAQIAAAALLIAAMFGGYIWFEGRNEQPAIVVQPATPVATPADDKTQYRYGPNRAGVSPSDGPAGQPVKLWSVQTQGPITAEPAVVDGVVYVGSGDGNLYAFDATSGAELWRQSVGIGEGSSPAVENGIAYFPNGDGTLFAVDAATGEERWSVPAGRDNSSPAIVDGVLFSGSLDGNLYALDAQTGDQIWSAPLGAGASRSVAVAGDLVYIGSDDGILHAFDRVSGEKRWQIETGDSFVGTPTIVDGVLYHGAGDEFNRVRFAHDAETGVELWSWSIEGGGQTSTPSVSEGRMYVSGSDGNLYALDTATGAEVWRFATGSPTGSTVSLAGGVVYVTTEDGNLYGVDAASGLEVFRFAIEGRQPYGPAILDGVAYVGNHLGVLYAITGTSEPAVQAPHTASPAASPVAEALSAELAWLVDEHLEGLDASGDVTVAPDGTVWLSDYADGDVFIFSPAGEFLERWTGSDLPGGALTVGEQDALQIGADGMIYAIDEPNRAIQIFDQDRNFVGAFGEEGEGQGQFLAPTDIAVDPDGNVWVSDWKTETVQKFAPNGAYLLTVGAPETPVGPRIGVDREGNLYAPGGGGARKFSPDGELLMTFGNEGSAEERLGAAIDIAVDDAGNIYVTDVLSNQVKVYDKSGSYVGSIGSFGPEPGQFIEPDPVTWSNGMLYVTDLGNNRWQVFKVTVAASELEATPAA